MSVNDLIRPRLVKEAGDQLDAAAKVLESAVGVSVERAEAFAKRADAHTRLALAILEFADRR